MEWDDEYAPLLPQLTFDSSVEGRLFAAGWDVVMSGDGSLFENGLNPESLAEAAGVSRRTFYRYFADKPSYVEALFTRVIEMSFISTPLELLAEVSARDVGLRTAIGDTAANYYTLLSHSNLVLARVVLISLAGKLGLHDLAADGHDKSVAEQVPVFEFLLDRASLEPRPPWTSRSVLIAVGSIFDGLTVRDVYRDQASNVAEMANLICVGLVPVLLRPKGVISDDLEQYQDDFYTRLQALLPERENAPAGTIRADIRAALINSLETKGLGETTTARLAVEAGTSERRVLANGTVDQQICTIVGDVFDDAAAELSFDLRLGQSDFPAILRRHDARIMAAVETHEAVMRAFLQLRVAGRSKDDTDKAFRLLNEAKFEYMEAAQIPCTPNIAATLIERKLAEYLLGWQD